MDKRILIVGSSPGSRVCERLVKRTYEVRLRSLDELDASEIEWCSFIITLRSALRREIAHAHPDAYLTKRVISLNIPEERAEDKKALTEMITEQLENNGLYVRT